MNRIWLTAFVMTAACLPGCTTPPRTSYTLYRNSPFGSGVRVHWATFDAAESDPAYNLNNCQMAARLLNANLGASAKAEGKLPSTGVGFWCEPGAYKETGESPSHFESAFPTDV